MHPTRFSIGGVSLSTIVVVGGHLSVKELEGPKGTEAPDAGVLFI